MSRTFALVLILFVLITGCIPKSVPAWPGEGYNIKEEAIYQYVKENNIQGTVVQVVVVPGKTLLVTEERTNLHYVGELAERQGKFLAMKISAGVEHTTGARWGFTTMDNRSYTISMSKDHVSALI